MNTFKWKQWNCKPVITKYHDGRTALQIVDANDGSTIATASVNMKGHLPPINDGAIYLKTWSENEGLAEALEEAGIVKFTGFEFPVNQWGSIARLVHIV